MFRREDHAHAVSIHIAKATEAPEVHVVVTRWRDCVSRLRGWHRFRAVDHRKASFVNSADRRRVLLTAGTTLTAALAIFSGTLPAVASSRAAHVPAAFAVRSFPAVGAETKPDDITRLGKNIYVAYQNGVGPAGEASPTTGATASTIQQYSLTGTPEASWSIPGHVDGLGADESHQRLLITTNEDANSSFHTLAPSARENAVKNYAYIGLTHGGGTDSVVINHGQILISASNPTTPAGPAVYEATLSGSTARLTPVFTDTATATLANGTGAGATSTLALTDPDSSTIVPAQSPRFGNEFLLDSQGDQQLIFADHVDTPKQHLQVLNLPLPVNDTAFATTWARTLWVTDPTTDTVNAITGPFHPGDAISAVTPNSGTTSLATLNLTTGTLTPIPQLAAIHPEGLLFTSPGRS